MTIRINLLQCRGGWRPQFHLSFCFYEAILLLIHTHTECINCSSTWAGGKRPGQTLCSNRLKKDG